jgi:hypothetical protein
VGKRQFKCTRRKASPIHFTVGPEKIRLQQLDLNAFGLDESYRNTIRIPRIVKLLPAVKTVQHRPQPTLGTSDVFYVDRSPGPRNRTAPQTRNAIRATSSIELRMRSAAQREPSRMLPLHLEKLEPPDCWSRAGCRPPSPCPRKSAFIPVAKISRP